jgi:hypothetical protein
MYFYEGVVLFIYSIHFTSVHTIVEMNNDCPNPNNNPVIKRIELELFLHFHRCVNPSMTNGIAMSMGIQMGTVMESKTAIGTNT